MKTAVAFILSIIVSFAAYSQGCSDAGFCTMGENLPSAQDTSSSPQQKLTLLLTNGIGDEGVYIFTPGVQYDFDSNNHFAFQGKVTGNYATGNLGSAAGAGDVFVSSTYTVDRKSKWRNSFTLGIKLPLSNGGLSNGDQALPMQYQASLGTVDAIGGYSTTYNKWLFAAAVQLPLTGANNNSFLPDSLANPDTFPYPSSNEFTRKADVLVRAGYQIRSTSKIKWSASLLAIYHVGEDTYVDKRVSETPISIVGSEGLTLNLTSAYYYQLNDKFSFGIVGGFPLVVRDVRPDGLTRGFAISPELILHF